MRADRSLSLVQVALVASVAAAVAAMVLTATGNVSLIP